MRRNVATNYLLYLFMVFLLWMPKRGAMAEESGYVLVDGKLTIQTTEGVGQWKGVNRRMKQSVTKIKIAEGSRNIPVYSFRNMVWLQSIEFPLSLELIGGATFFRCQRLSRVNFPPNSKLKVIGSSAFVETALRSVFIPASVRKIGCVAFGDCKRLGSLFFAEDANLENVGITAFYETDVRFVQFPSSVSVIDAGVFSHSKVRFVYILESVVAIKNNAF